MKQTREHANAPRLSTTFLLLAQYEGRAFITVDELCRDYFQHLTPVKFLRKVAEGQIAIPLTPIETSQKSTKAVHLQDFADYLDRQREAALKEFNLIHG